MRFRIAIARHDRPLLGRSPLVASVTLMCPSHQRRPAGISTTAVLRIVLQLGRHRALLHNSTGRQSLDLHCFCPLSPRYDMATTSSTCHTDSVPSSIGAGRRSPSSQFASSSPSSSVLVLFFLDFRPSNVQRQWRALPFTCPTSVLQFANLHTPSVQPPCYNLQTCTRRMFLRAISSTTLLTWS